MTTSSLVQLEQILKASEQYAGRIFSEEQVESFVRYYELVLKWNANLHLTTLISPEDFAERHLFEAVFLSLHIDYGAKRGWDLGTGLGIPGIVVALLRPTFPMLLAETNRKKVVFLEEVAHSLALHNVSLSNQPIQKLPPPERDTALMVRAIDGMSSLLPYILKMSRSAAQLLLLGSSATEDEVKKGLSEQQDCVSQVIPRRDDSRLISVIMK